MSSIRYQCPQSDFFRDDYQAQPDVTALFIERYELANGEVVAQEVFAGRIVFDGQEQEVEVILTTSQDTLIGAALLQLYTLIVDYPTQEVRLAKNRRRKASST